MVTGCLESQKAHLAAASAARPLPPPLLVAENELKGKRII